MGRTLAFVNNSIIDDNTYNRELLMSFVAAAKFRRQSTLNCAGFVNLVVIPNTA